MNNLLLSKLPAYGFHKKYYNDTLTSVREVFIKKLRERMNRACERTYSTTPQGLTRKRSMFPSYRMSNLIPKFYKLV